MSWCTCEIGYYVPVSPNSTEEMSQTLETGESVRIFRVGGNAAKSEDVKVEIWVGDDLLLATHGDATRVTDLKYTGDGTYGLKIKLVNNSSQTETIGGYISAVKKY